MAKIIKANGFVVNIEPENGTDFQYNELNKIVGGYIEIIYLNDGNIMVINEEGKLNSLPLNSQATIKARLCGGISFWDFIVGDVLYCDKKQVK